MGSNPEREIIRLENLDLLTRERIWVPVVRKLYEEYVANGTFQKTVELLDLLPSELHPPILYTLTTHVTKEKPVFVHAIGESCVVDQERAKFLAASTDILWALSLMVDDIFDKDLERANKEATWVVFGEERTIKAAEGCLKALLEESERRISPKAKDLLWGCISDGLASLKAPEIFSLKSTPTQIFDNIMRRARFHCEFPIRSIFMGLEGGEVKAMETAIRALHAVNLGGQALNDTKDIVNTELYGRQSFSDIKNGISSLPLILLYEKLTGEEKRKFEACFGNQNLSPKETIWLCELITLRLPVRQIEDVALRAYSQFLVDMATLITPENFLLCHDWVNYKLAQSKELLKGVRD